MDVTKDRTLKGQILPAFIGTTASQSMNQLCRITTEIERVHDKQPYTACIATTREEREAAYRIRYSAYIQEQGKPYLDADHNRQLFTDGFDASASVVLVRRPSGPCGTVRANWADSIEVRQGFASQFEFWRFEKIPDRSISICSRLAILPGFRATIVAKMLFAEIYRLGLRRDTSLCFEVCASTLRPLFERYGFREYLSPYQDQLSGLLLHRMVLVLDDVGYLERVGSPFLGIARKMGVANCVRPWLDEFLSEQSRKLG
jgi:hypothetical protein